MFLNDLHVLFKDAGTVDHFLGSEIKHEAIISAPLLEQLGGSLVVGLWREHDDGSDSYNGSQDNELLHRYEIIMNCQVQHIIFLMEIQIAQQFIKTANILQLPQCLTLFLRINVNEQTQQLALESCLIAKQDVFLNVMNQFPSKFAESIRKKEREEVMSSKRQWIQVPSPVFQLPFRIEKEEWQNFELLLDSFAEKEVALVDAALREYLLQQWQKITPKWEDAKAINVIRILFRLRIAQNQHAKTIIKLLHAAKEEFEKTNNLQAGRICKNLRFSPFYGT